MFTDLKECKALHEIIFLVLMAGNYLNAVSVSLLGGLSGPTPAIILVFLGKAKGKSLLIKVKSWSLFRERGTEEGIWSRQYYTPGISTRREAFCLRSFSQTSIVSVCVLFCLTAAFPASRTFYPVYVILCRL